MLADSNFCVIRLKIYHFVLDTARTFDRFFLHNEFNFGRKNLEIYIIMIEKTD